MQFLLTRFFDDKQDGLPAGVLVVLEAHHTVVLILVGAVDSVGVMEHWTEGGREGGREERRRMTLIPGCHFTTDARFQPSEHTGCEFHILLVG